MIPQSRRLAATALVFSGALHLSGLTMVWQDDPVLMEGGTPVSVAKLGNSFQDLAQGTQVPQTPIQEIEPTPAEDLAPGPETAHPETPLEPVELQEPDRPTEITRQDRPDQTEQALKPDTTLTQIQELPTVQTPQVEQVPLESERKEPVDPDAPETVVSPEPIRPDRLALAAPETLEPVASEPVELPEPEPVELVQPDRTELAEAEPLAQLKPQPVMQPTPPDRPQTLAVLTPLSPVRPADPVESALTEPDTMPLIAAALPPDLPEGVQVSKRPKPRPRTETAEKPKPSPRKTAAQPPRRTGSNEPDQVRGSDQGEAKAKQAESSDRKSRTARRAGNAAVSNYPGQVMRKISRMRRPRVNSRGSATVAFSVSGNGGLGSVRIASSSGSAALDKAALELVRRAAPFPPPPSGALRNFSVRIKGR